MCEFKSFVHPNTVEYKYGLVPSLGVVNDVVIRDQGPLRIVNYKHKRRTYELRGIAGFAELEHAQCRSEQGEKFLLTAMPYSVYAVFDTQGWRLLDEGKFCIDSMYRDLRLFYFIRLLLLLSVMVYAAFAGAAIFGAYYKIYFVVMALLALAIAIVSIFDLYANKTYFCAVDIVYRKFRDAVMY